jgi:hypothetical protein
MLLAALVAAGVAIRQRAQLLAKVGPPNWDFSKSWATNITVLGAVVATFLSSKVVPNPQLLPAASYLMLAILFAAIAAIAPLVFRASSTKIGVTTPEGTSDIQFQGNVTGFLIAMGMTLWATLGQLATLGALSLEVIAIRKGGTVEGGVLTLVLALGLVATVWYAWSTAGPLLFHQTNLGAHADRLLTQMEQMNVSPPSDFDPTQAPLPEWRLL